MPHLSMDEWIWWTGLAIVVGITYLSQNRRNSRLSEQLKLKRDKSFKKEVPEKRRKPKALLRKKTIVYLDESAFDTPITVFNNQMRDQVYERAYAPTPYSYAPLIDSPLGERLMEPCGFCQTSDRYGVTVGWPGWFGYPIPFNAPHPIIINQPNYRDGFTSLDRRKHRLLIFKS
jgi:hypothetical protein